MSSKLTVSSSPHLGSPVTTKNIMLDVVIALIPALIASFFLFGARALLLTAVTTTTCVAVEYIARRIMKRSNTIHDCSAIVTGILLAFNYPATLPIWMAVLGGIIAIVVVKQMFGGIGYNFVNPALAARVVLMMSFPTAMTTYPNTLISSGADAISGATPLALLSAGDTSMLPSYLDMFLGNRASALGENCILALIIGGIYLIARKVISPIIPLTYITAVFGFSALLGQNPLAQILSGGLFLGAIFMASDYTTSPLTNKGKVIYALGCGLLTTIIRAFGALPEGVAFSILIMNILVPHIEKFTIPTAFGTRKGISK